MKIDNFKKIVKKKIENPIDQEHQKKASDITIRDDTIVYDIVTGIWKVNKL
jgi:hypothetical protein